MKIKLEEKAMLDIVNWVVVSGGPGLSNNYLKYALKNIPLRGNLYFYNLYGSPESDNKDPSIHEMVDQIKQVAVENKLEKYGIIAHSFGSYLALRALEENASNIQALIMLNPVPFEYSAWKASLSSIVEKVPQSILDQLDELSGNPDEGGRIFKLIYPYYIGHKASNLPVEVELDVGACNAISEKVSQYSDIDLVSSLTIPVVRIVGELDPFFSDNGVLPDTTIVISEVGHYPFFEATDIFNSVIKKTGELICQRIKKIANNFY